MGRDQHCAFVFMFEPVSQMMTGSFVGSFLDSKNQ